MNEWDVAVVGAGIAGLTAARTCAEHGLRTVAYDRLAPGGQLINLGELSAFPTPDGTPANGPDFAGALLDGAMSAGVEAAYGEVGAISPGPAADVELTTDDGPVRARAVVVATGLTPGRLDMPGAEEWVGRGLSECATCDGPLHKGRDVVVAGGDEWAGREAIELAGIAAHVTVAVPDTPTWSPPVAARLAETVEVRTGVSVAGLSGDAGIAEARLTDGTAVPASAVFVYTGKTPRRELLDGLPGGLPVYAAGDVASPDTPYLLTAAADGLRTGLAVCARLLS